MEVIGALIQGYAQACLNLKLIAGDKAANMVKDIEPTSWYPLEIWQSLADIITEAYDDPAPIMTQVGIEMMTGWYHYGGGKDIVKKGVEFLSFQTGSEGYKSVIKGPPEIIGDFKLISCNVEKGEAVVESSTPFNRDMEKGVLIGGMKAPGDIDYIDIENEKDKDRFIITFYYTGKTQK